MSREIFELVKNLDLGDVTTQMVLQCAPLISGLKFSNLLIMHNENVDALDAILEGSDISYYVLFENEKKTTLLLYRREELERYLEDAAVQDFMKSLGYESFVLEDILVIFTARYEEYMSKRESFPHEMGILLGYPLCDVKGFVDNDGKNCLFSGYWKVYANLTETKTLFNKFQIAKENMIHLVSCGMGIRDIIEIYDDSEPYAYMAV